MLIKSKLTNSVIMLVQLINESHWSLNEKEMKSFTLRYWFSKMKKKLKMPKHRSPTAKFIAFSRVILNWDGNPEV